eukprot:358582-Chlamydomonas_euryale.AAC.4
MHGLRPVGPPGSLLAFFARDRSVQQTLLFSGCSSTLRAAGPSQKKAHFRPARRPQYRYAHCPTQTSLRVLQNIAPIDQDALPKSEMLKACANEECLGQCSRLP